jgi:predicted DNA-binding transcriptional regulator AlpA
VKLESDDLMDSTEVAQRLGLKNMRAVSVYRGRYSDFPAPVVTKGHCMLWHRLDVERWAKAHGR